MFVFIRLKNQAVIESCIRPKHPSMHELPVIENILNVVLKYAEQNHVTKVISISIRVGDLTDLVNEWMQRYFDFVSKNTLAEGAILKITRTPVVFQCRSCQLQFNVTLREIKDVSCTACGSQDVGFVSGREFFIENMEVV